MLRDRRPTSNLLALGEMALQKQCEQPTELVWTPPDGVGEPSVFDIVWSHLEPVYDLPRLPGLGMEQVVTRSQTYLVRMQALPHARTRDRVATEATEVVVTPTYTLIDDGSSLTGWSEVGGDGSLSIVSGMVVARSQRRVRSPVG